MSVCKKCLHRVACGKYAATGGVKDCKDYVFEEKIWCNNCYCIYRKVDVPYRGIVQYCPNCGLMIGTMVGRVKRCGCGAIIPEEFDCCPNCDTKMDGGETDG